MSMKEREILLKLHQQVLKLTQPPATTFAPSTGEIPQAPEYTPSSLPLPVNQSTKR